MERNILQENMKRFKTLNLSEQEEQPQPAPASNAPASGGLDMQKALAKAGNIDGLGFGKYLGNIKGIVTSMLDIGQKLLDSAGAVGDADDSTAGGDISRDKENREMGYAARKEKYCEPIRSEMDALAPLATALLDRMRNDAQSDLRKQGLLAPGAQLSWDDYAALMSENYGKTKIGLLTIIKPILKTALAAFRTAMSFTGSFYVDSAIVAMLTERIKKHCGNNAGGTIASLMMETITEVIPVSSSGLTC